MALYRCAACGSPNVVTDTQAGGIKYNYLKGALGTVALGAGGAAAGITSETQQVFKCPDCGVTLTYAMPQDMKNLIDIGVLSVDARSNLTYSGMPVSWDFLLSKYKNIETGLGDRMAAKDAENKRLKALKGIEILKSKGSATKEAFDAAIDQMKHFEHRMGYDRGIYDAVHEDEYTPEKPTTLTDYLTLCQAVGIYFENYFKYLDFPEDSETKYHDLSLQFSFKRYFPFYLHFKLCEEYNTNTVESLSTSEIGDYILDDPFLTELSLLFFRKLARSYAKDRAEAAFRDYDSAGVGGCILGFVIRQAFPQWLKYASDAVRPYFMVKDGALYYWDASFQTAPLGDDNYLKSDRHKNAMASHPLSGASSDAFLDAIKENYFSYYPEKKAEYDDLIKKREKDLSEAKHKEEIAASNRKEVKQLKAQIETANTEISALEKKIFGKKKAAESIAAIKDSISQYESECKTLEEEIEKLDNEPKPISEKDFSSKLLKQFDYYIAWHRVEEPA